MVDTSCLTQALGISVGSNSREYLLIQEILSGQNEPFWDLVRPHLPFVCRTVRVRVGNAYEAEDVVQDTLLKAFAQLQQFRFESSFRTWLIKIAINEIRGRHRHTIRARSFAFADCGINENEIRETLPSQLEIWEQHEMAKQIGQAIAGLPEKYRSVIKLRDFEQLSIVETAHRLCLTTSAVRTRHQRARTYVVRSLKRLNRQ